jgi:uncharacterized SAM-dependent methyltransferase
MQTSVHYFALDLSRTVLEDSMAQLASSYQHVKCFALWGTYEEARGWSQKIEGPRFFMSLGSVFGNDRFDAAVALFKRWADALRPQDRMLIGMDAKNDADAVWKSYHDDGDLFETFMRNALSHSNTVLGVPWYRKEDWEVVGVIEKIIPVKHRFVFRAKRDVLCKQLNLDFKAADEIDCYEVFKYGPTTMRMQFEQAGLKDIAVWLAPSASFCEF